MHPKPTPHLAWLVAVLVLAFGLRVAAAIVWQQRLPDESALEFGDSETYWQLGRSIARGNAYVYEGSKIFRTPAYPTLLAGLFVVGGEDLKPIAARWLGAILGTLTVFGIWWLTWKLFNHPTALLAAIIVAFYPGAIFTSVLVLAEALFCPLMILQLIFWQTSTASASTRRRWVFALLAGVTAGLAVLARPSWLAFTPLAAGVALLTGHQRKQHLQIAAGMVLALLLVLSPWWVRNYRAVGAFVPTTTQVGASLYDGLHDGATGASDMRFVPEAKQNILAARARGKLPVNVPLELQLDRHLRNEALTWAVNHPTDALRLAGIKFARLWNIWPNEPAFRRWWLRLMVMCSYTPVMGFAMVGGWRFVRRGWPYVLCLAPAIYFTCLHTLFIGSIRYRQPAMLPLMVLAAAAVISCWNRFKESSS